VRHDRISAKKHEKIEKNAMSKKLSKYFFILGDASQVVFYRVST
jgi:hypothetical protein